MRRVRCALPALALLALPPAALPRSAPVHPLWGTWTYTLADGICRETHDFQPDGTDHVASGAARYESNYQVGAAPSPRGYYRLDETITQVNGQRDCTGELPRTDHESTVYVRLHPSGQQLLLCESEAPEACVGPLDRTGAAGR